MNDDRKRPMKEVICRKMIAGTFSWERLITFSKRCLIVSYSRLPGGRNRQKQKLVLQVPTKCLSLFLFVRISEDFKKYFVIRDCKGRSIVKAKISLTDSLAK